MVKRQERGGVPDDRIAVRLGVFDVTVAFGAGVGGLIAHADRLAQIFLRRLAENTRDHVGRAALTESDDQFHTLGFLPARRQRERADADQKKQTETQNHAAPVTHNSLRQLN